MSREDIRRGVAAYFGGPTQDARDFYRPSPLQGLGLSGVLPYFVNYDGRFDDRDYFEGLAAGATFGAVMCVHLAVAAETRLEVGGVLDRPYATELYLWWQDVTADPQAAQGRFDGLLDAVVGRIRADPTLGMGVNSDAPTKVTQAGEGTQGVTVTSPPPYTEPGRFTFGSAVVSFNVNTYPAG